MQVQGRTGDMYKTGKHKTGRIVKSLLCVAAAALISSCGTLKPVSDTTSPNNTSTFRRIIAAIFTNAAVNDLVFEGATSGDSIDIAVEIANARDPQLAAALQFAIQSKLIEPVGPRFLPVLLKGETTPRLLICRTALAAQCANIAKNTGVRAYVQPIGFDKYSAWIVHRIVVL